VVCGTAEDVKWVLMEKAILLAVTASLCTATASVCQRIGAKGSETAGFDVWLVFRLARQQLREPGYQSAGSTRHREPQGPVVKSTAP
jgi:hypothetical protein